MPRPVRVCIVTDELYPFTAGGIGRVVHNIVSDTLARGAPVDLHLLPQRFGHAHPARDRQPIGVIRDAHARVSERQAGFSQGRDALRPVAPGAADEARRLVGAQVDLISVVQEGATGRDEFGLRIEGDHWPMDSK